LSAGTMQLSDPAAGPAKPGDGWATVTPDLSTLQPRVTARLDDKLDILAIFDTGAPSLVLISDQVEHHGINLLANRRWGGNAVIGGVGGYELTTCGPLAKVTVGPFAFTGTEACESPAWSTHEGLIGFDFLKHFDYIFDYPHGLMYMKPRQ
jgi:hypothetical protein